MSYVWDIRGPGNGCPLPERERLARGAERLPLVFVQGNDGRCPCAHGGFALIDERKANRICAERFPQLRVAATTDIFMQPDVERALAPDRLAQGVVNALCLARMRVLPEHLDWVVTLVGVEQAALCPSLPKTARSGRKIVAD